MTDTFVNKFKCKNCEKQMSNKIFGDYCSPKCKRNGDDSQ